ncbi:unnamed protein product [Amoebophrya sp. A120]|nr:unnamed protein product [Amoebophrya sp. A120]|eukprot:GSA120T00023267001.1
MRKHFHPFLRQTRVVLDVYVFLGRVHLPLLQFLFLALGRGRGGAPSSQAQYFFRGLAL